MFRDAEPADALELVTGLVAAIPPFPLDLSSVGTFPGSEGVVFLKPERSIELAHAHQVFCNLLESERHLLPPHYEPASWQPHCTLALGVPEALLPDVMRAADPSGIFGSVRVERVQVNRYFPIAGVCGLPLRPLRV
jgi:2'-5' RNA ligase